MTKKTKCSPWTFKHWLIKVNEDCTLVTASSPDVRSYATVDFPVYITCIACFDHTNTGCLFYPKDQPSNILCNKHGNIVYDGNKVEAATCE